MGNQYVTIEFYDPTIVRVVKASNEQADATTHTKSYSVIMKPQRVKSVGVREDGDVVTMESPQMTVSLNQKTGEIRFLSKEGKPLLTDTQAQLEARQDDANKGKYRITQNFRLADDEAIWGLGQLRDKYMNHWGCHVELWNHNTYIAIPYFTSEKGYGLYWDNAGKTYFDDTVASEGKSSSENTTSFTSEVGTCADYYLMYKDGTQDGVIDCIRKLTGQATMFPKWTLGFWQCRERYKTSDEKDQCALAIRHMAAKQRRDAIRCENFQTHDGSWLSVKNAFPLLHNKSINEYQRAMRGNEKRSVQMTRSGSFGLQHYGTFSWSGDVDASWEE